MYLWRTVLPSGLKKRIHLTLPLQEYLWRSRSIKSVWWSY